MASEAEAWPPWPLPPLPRWRSEPLRVGCSWLGGPEQGGPGGGGAGQRDGLATTGQGGRITRACGERDGSAWQCAPGRPSDVPGEWVVPSPWQGRSGERGRLVPPHGRTKYKLSCRQLISIISVIWQFGAMHSYSVGAKLVSSLETSRGGAPAASAAHGSPGQPGTGSSGKRGGQMTGM